jgi:PBSX family phage terminase large subunit
VIESLTEKQRASVLGATRRINVWSGSVRSGKTVASEIAWLRQIRSGPPGPLLMVGKTNRSLKRNVLDPLVELLGPKRITLRMGDGEATILGRRVYLVGANDERSMTKIQGLTLAGLYGDEMTTWPESFFKMGLSRLSLPGAWLGGTVNPDAPLHWLKKNFIDRADVLNAAVFEFRLEDNTSLDPSYVAALKLEYVGLWYKRYILGLWIAAEGPIYDMLDVDVHVADAVPDDVEISRRWLGVDYGTSNPFVAILFGEGSDGVVYALDSYRYDSRVSGRQKTDAQYRVEVEAWLSGVLRDGESIEAAYVDPSAASFIAECGMGWLPASGAANDVSYGIRYVSSLLGNVKLRIVGPRCSALVETLQSYAWDPKKQAKGIDEPMKVDDHDADAFRYGVYTDALSRLDPSATGFV